MRIELIERACLDGVMAGIMRTRRKLVDNDPLILGDEQFDGENARQFESLRQAQRKFVRLLRHGFADFGRSNGHMQDIVAMLVTNNREGHVILAVACNENACFENTAPGQPGPLFRPSGHGHHNRRNGF